VRIDNQDPNTAFWSNYTSKKPSVLVGKLDLRTNRWTAERRLDLPKEVLDFGKTTTKTLYCAPGQTERYFLPIFMGYPGFIDVIDKKDLSLKRRVMMASNPELPTNCTYTHLRVGRPPRADGRIPIRLGDRDDCLGVGLEEFVVLSDSECLVRECRGPFRGGVVFGLVRRGRF